MDEIQLRPNSNLQESGVGLAEQGFEGNAPPIASFGSAQGCFTDAMAPSGSPYSARRQHNMGVPPQPAPVSLQFVDIHSGRSIPVQALDSAVDAPTAVNSTPPENQGSFVAVGRDVAAIAMENQRLREQRLCKLCRRRDVDAVLLPCGHLCMCKDCVQLCLSRGRESGSGRCHTCRRNIRGFERIFY